MNPSNFTEKLAGMSVVNVLIISAILIIIRVVLKGNEHPFWKQVAEFSESLAFAFLLVFLLIRPFFIQSFFIPSASMRPTLLEKDHLIANKFVYFFKDPRFNDVIIFKAPMEATKQNPNVKPYTPPANKTQRFWDVISNGDTRLDFIKRVIGEPGDEIRITPGYIETAVSMEYPDGIIMHNEISRRLEVFAAAGKDGYVKIKSDGVYIDNVKLDENKVKEALYVRPNEKFILHPGEVYRNGKKLNEPFIAEDAGLPFPMKSQIADKPDWIIKKDGVYWAKIPKDKYLVMGDNRNDSYDARFWGFLDRDSIKGKAMFTFWPLNRIKIIK